jgi:hypothetical protein
MTTTIFKCFRIKCKWNQDHKCCISIGMIVLDSIGECTNYVEDK